MSNEDAGHAMADVITGHTKHIYLSHLSRDNNMKDLARMSVGQVLNELISILKKVLLCDTDKATSDTDLYVIKLKKYEA